MAEALSATLAVSCPAKIILHGEHAVVFGESALVTSVDMRTYAMLKYIGDPLDGDSAMVHFKMSQLNIDSSWPFETIKSKVTSEYSETLEGLKSLANQVDANSNSYAFVASLVFLYLFSAIRCGKEMSQSICIEVYTDAPLGAGLGSSAALAVCVSALLLTLTDEIQMPDSINRDITMVELKECIARDEISSHFFSRESLSSINNWGFAAEKIVHGTPSGIDNAICTHGGTMKFRGGNFSALKAFPPNNLLSLIIIDSLIPKSTQRMLSLVRDKHEELPGIFNPIFSSIGAISERCIQEFTLIISNEVIPNYKLLEDLIFINHQLLCAIGVSCLELDSIHNIAKELGFATKLTGSGGGGCMLGLITPDNEGFVDEFIEIISEKGFKSWRTKYGVKGVCYHLPSTLTDS